MPYDSQGFDEPWSPGCGRPSGAGDFEAWCARQTAKREAEREERREAFEARLSQPKPPPQRRPGASRFTTEAAIRWGRAQGWKLVDRERWDALNRRHHDLQLALDALMDDGEGLVGLQGAGRHERAAHRRRFEEGGGVETARRRSIRIVYLEFTRGSKEPGFVEWWG